jgi:hypothetical protein
VKIAKANLVPIDHNLRGEYEDFAALEIACEQFMAILDIFRWPLTATDVAIAPPP